jgi:hypothetical protein
LDGYFTYIGVKNLGIGIEANPLIIYSIERFGLIIGLIIPKIFAILILIFIMSIVKDIHITSKRVSGIKLLTLLNIFYIGVVWLWFIELLRLGLLP